MFRGWRPRSLGPLARPRSDQRPGNRVLPLAEFDAAVHQRQQGEWFWKQPDYCNNFIFCVPPGRATKHA